MAVYKKVPGCETVNISTLEFDTKPTKGSFNPVTSDGMATQSDNIAEAFSASSTYAIGEVVIGPDGKLYQCTTAVETAGEWDPEDWTETSIADLIEQDMKDMEEMFLLNLPIAAKTFRFEFSKRDYDPTVAGVGSTGTWKKLNAKFHNVWDWTKSGTSFSDAFREAFVDESNLVSVIAVGDTSSVTLMNNLFRGCNSLTSVPLFNTSAVTNISYMFSGCKLLSSVPLFNTSSVTLMNDFLQGCKSLTSVPLFNTSAVTNMSYMFFGCTKVESGALALYQQASTQATPPATHTDTFKNCGNGTETGSAELAQIPESWGGTAAG